MAWRSEADDTVPLPESVSLDLNVTNDLTDMTFKDAAAAGDFAELNVVALDVPVGIESGASKITIDEASIPASLVLEHLITIGNGAEELLATHRNADSGAAKVLSPTSVSYGYRIRVKNGVLVGFKPATDQDNDVSLTTAFVYQNDAQEFTLSEDRIISHIYLRLKQTGGTQNVLVRILKNRDDEADTNPDIIGSNAVTVAGPWTIADASIPASYGWVSVGTGSFSLKAGTYFISVAVSALPGTDKQWARDAGTYGGGDSFPSAGGANVVRDANYDQGFLIFGTGDPEEGGAPTGTGDTCNLDNPILEFDDTTPQTPYVALGAEVVAYLMDATLRNKTAPGYDSGVVTIEPLDAAETTIDVSDATPFLTASAAEPISIQIDSEYMEVTTATVSVIPNTIGVSARGALGSTAATHVVGATIKIATAKIRIYAPIQLSPDVAADETLAIDFEELTVTHSDDDLSGSDYLVGLLELGAEREPFALSPGANTLMWTEDGVVGVNVRTIFKEKWL
jgi:hypothetical protein